MKKISNCYNCKERHLGCHSNCQSYKEYKLYLENIKERKQKEKINYASRKRGKSI